MHQVEQESDASIVLHLRLLLRRKSILLVLLGKLVHSVQVVAVETDRQQRLGGFDPQVAVIGSDQAAEDSCFAGRGDRRFGSRRAKPDFKLCCWSPEVLLQIGQIGNPVCAGGSDRGDTGNWRQLPLCSAENRPRRSVAESVAFRAGRARRLPIPDPTRPLRRECGSGIISA